MTELSGYERCTCTRTKLSDWERPHEVGCPSIFKLGWPLYVGEYVTAALERREQLLTGGAAKVLPVCEVET